MCDGVTGINDEGARRGGEKWCWRVNRFVVNEAENRLVEKGR